MVTDLAGLRLALTLFTVAPAGSGRPDRAAARVAMALAPLVGALIGVLVGGAGIGMRALGASTLVAAAMAVALGVAVTRGLHLDGLADTVDALGVYSDHARALEVMKRPEIGAFGVIAIALALLAQAASAATLLERPWTSVLAGFAVAAATGRLAASMACRSGVPAARSGGLGALVAGTLHWPVLLVAWGAVATVAIGAVPGRPWQGPLATLAGPAVAQVVVKHAVRRFGGITGDVLGAVVEVAATVSYVVLALS
jgi:adenosylcobinamide-GDP ribazoletransferase